MAALAFVCCNFVEAQPLDRSPAARAARAAARAATFGTALASARTGNLEGAEAALFKDNVQRPNSLEWDIESAMKLTHLALTLRERLDYANARRAADRALVQLNDGLSHRSSGASSARRALAFEVAAFIYERLHVNRAAAKAAYSQAQALHPASAAAATALGRIQDSELNEARVRGGKG